MTMTKPDDLQETILGETNEDEDAYKCPNMRPGNMAVAVLAVAALVVACVAAWWWVTL